MNYFDGLLAWPLADTFPTVGGTVECDKRIETVVSISSSSNTYTTVCADGRRARRPLYEIKPHAWRCNGCHKCA